MFGCNTLAVHVDVAHVCIFVTVELNYLEAKHFDTGEILPINL